MSTLPLPATVPPALPLSPLVKGRHSAKPDTAPHHRAILICNMLLQRKQHQHSPTRFCSLPAAFCRRTGGGGRSTLRMTPQCNYDDPLTTITCPPANESECDRQARTTRESDAKKRSDEIDKMLKEDAARAKSEKTHEKMILLLGQAEAGKTTVVKQMRMLYAPARQARLRRTWTDVIFLNIVLAVKSLVLAYQKALSDEQHAEFAGEQAQRSLPLASSASPLSSLRRSPSIATVDSGNVELSEHSHGSLSSKSLLSRLRLAPLLSMEADLRRRLGAFEEAPLRKEGSLRKASSLSFDDVPRHLKAASNTLLLKAGWQESLLGGVDGEDAREAQSDQGHANGIAGRVKHDGPKAHGIIDTAMHPLERESSDLRSDLRRTSNEQKRMQCLLDACVPEIQGLLQSLRALKKGQDLAGFSDSDSAAYFLNHIKRFTDPEYEPTDDDILRARVRTIGVYEEKFMVSKQLSYRIVDVGGSLSQRNVWAQFFADATAIIFLAPISAFDEYLVEAPTTNKIKDSLQLWEAITASPLLRRVSLILFLNKIDILKGKLKAGKQIKAFFGQYKGDNSFEDVWRYFRSLFVAIANKHEAEAPTRNLYIDKTNATSTREIKVILTSCQDIILRQHLKDSAFT